MQVDPGAVDPATVLRLPSFVHRKASPHLVELLECPSRVYHREELLQVFQPLDRWQFIRPEQDGEITFCLEEFDRRNPSGDR